MHAVSESVLDLCAYCGARSNALTQDHVIPQALWKGSHLPQSTITVPACGPCHKHWDRESEYFRNILIAQIDRGAHAVSDRLLEGPVMRSLARNRAARTDFFRNNRRAEIRNRSGLILGFRTAFEIDVSRFSRSIEKIVRGLFYQKSRYALPSAYRVAVARGNEFWSNDGFQKIHAAMEPFAGCGDDVFMMRCVRDNSDVNVTAWLLQFYRCLAMFAWTDADNKSDGISTVSSRDSD